MPSVFWTGRLTLPMWLLVNVNNALALVLGQATDVPAMKARVRSGYEGRSSQHVQRYDELGLQLQERSAGFQLRAMDLAGKSVLDVGCGTGVLALMALDAGAREALCGDIAMLMIDEAKLKTPPRNSPYRFCQLDGEKLPFEDGSFDACLSGMTFGLFPNQRKALAEMLRVTRPGGLVSIGAHGPEHYWEAIDGCFRCIGKRRILGYRLEFWPRGEAYLRRMASACGLDDVHSRREIWRTRFPSGGAMYDFFAAISASWWYSKFPPEEAQRDSERTRAFFERKAMATITDDVIAVWGRKAS
jgi:ubiquinone/menaquinone biosynthesis C-methylase UbiE